MKLSNSRCLVLAAILVFCGATSALAQQAGGGDDNQTAVEPGKEQPCGVEGQVYDLPRTVRQMPDFSTLTLVQSVHMTELNVPLRANELGFPGIDRDEYFTVNFHGFFRIPQTGKYRFRLTADDVAQLWIDGRLLIDLEKVVRSTRIDTAAIELTAGSHEIRVPYYEGPPPYIALVLEMARDGEPYKVLNMCPAAIPKPVLKPVAATRQVPSAPQADRPEARVSLDSAILFDFDKFTLKPGSDAILAQIKASVFDKHPAGRFIIEGHTDDRGSEAYNLKLSQRRAQAVVNWLQTHGIPASRLVARGYGLYKPKVPNATDADRAQNRRVEVVVVD